MNDPTDLPTPREAPAPLVIATSFCALFFPTAVSRFLAPTDYARELQRNAPLRESTPEKKAEYIQQLMGATASRARLLRAVLLKSNAWLASATIAGWIADRTLPSIVADSAAALTLLSVGAFAWATLGRLGWAGQTFSGRTVIERLDDFLFRSLYWVGMFLGTIAIL